MTERDLILNLNAAGFDESLAQEFVDCWKAGKTVEQLRLLANNERGCWSKFIGRKNRFIAWTIWSINSGKMRGCERSSMPAQAKR